MSPNLSDETLLGLKLWDGVDCERGEFLTSRFKDLEAERRRLLLDGREAGVEKARRLMTLKAIGPVSAYVLGREVFGWRRFANRRQVGAFLG